MWQVHAMVALDLARERAREAEAMARRWRRTDVAEAERLRRAPDRFAAGRALLAGLLRRLSAGADSVAIATCRAASRVEGRPA
jgi:hypothetical protein